MTVLFGALALLTARTTDPQEQFGDIEPAGFLPQSGRTVTRALHQDYDDGNGDDRFEWDLTLHGPMAGFAMTF